MPDHTIRIDLELPKELFIKGRASDQWVKMEALKRLAATFYADGSLSLGKAAELANVSKREFLDFLGAHNIPLNYDLDELEEDLATVKEFLQNESAEASVTQLCQHLLM
ncbi:MAG: UPF0175 family protein [Pelotomaculum sp.]|nr:UPF0175 family protein [Pelotomaculum sp.]